MTPAHTIGSSSRFWGVQDMLAFLHVSTLHSRNDFGDNVASGPQHIDACCVISGPARYYTRRCHYGSPTVTCCRDKMDRETAASCSHRGGLLDQPVSDGSLSTLGCGPQSLATWIYFFARSRFMLSTGFSVGFLAHAY